MIDLDENTEIYQTTNQGPGRFSIVSDSDVDNFNLQQTNRNTLTKTISDLKILKSFFQEPEVGEVQEIHEIPEDELSPLLCRFIVGVRKQNGEDYEPSVLRGMISSFDRQLRCKAYPQTISQGPAFARVRETLTMKQRQLKKDGKGNLPRKSEPLSDDDIDHLWKSCQLGVSTTDFITRFILD